MVQKAQHWESALIRNTVVIFRRSKLVVESWPKQVGPNDSIVASWSNTAKQTVN